MATQVQNRRGTTAEHATFTGAAGEVTVDTTKDTVVVHDGSTAGGAALLREDQTNLPTSAPANGVFLPSANTLGVATNGTGRLFIDASGKVEVSTATGSSSITPTELRISSTTDANDWNTTDPWARLGFYSADTTNGARTRAAIDVVQQFTNGNVSAFSFKTDNGSGTLVERQRITYTGTTTLTSAAATEPLIVKIDTSEVARIDSSGRVGIGTGTPDTLLTVNGSAKIGTSTTTFTNSKNISQSLAIAGTYTPGIMMKASGLYTGEWSVYLKAGASVTSFAIADDADDRLVIDSSGRVGIGTTSPTGTLNVHTTGTADVDKELCRWSTASGGILGILVDETQANPTWRFRYATNESLAFVGSSTERARIDSSGRLLVGTSTNIRGSKLQVLSTGNDHQSLVGGNQIAQIELCRSSDSAGGAGLVADGNVIARIECLGNDGSAYRAAARIEAVIDATPGASDMPGRLVFSTTADGGSSPTERMRISNNGRVGINDDTAGFAELLQIDGTGNISNGYALATKVGVTTSAFHVRFVDTTGIIGSITSNAGTVAYNPFLGCHWARLENGEKIQVPVGTIIETVDKEIEWNFAVFDCQGETKKMAWNGTEKPGETVEVSYGGNTYTAIIKPESVEANVLNKHVCVKVNDTPNAPGVFGVFFGYDSDEGSTDFIGSWNDFYVAAVGNYFIRIAAQETVQIGDLISSDGTGCGVVQATDAITSKTVAKVTSTKKHTVYEDGSYLVTCVLYCG